jgi:Lar family restriction alleviation protein
MTTPSPNPAAPVEVVLKACPFCGGQARDNGAPLGVRGNVSCLECGAVGPMAVSNEPKKAVAAWNARAANAGVLGADAIFDHRYLDPVCISTGCQSLRLRGALLAYLKAQRRMLDQWAEVDEPSKSALWRALHDCEAEAARVLEDRLNPTKQPRADGSTDQEYVRALRRLDRFAQPPITGDEE